MNGLTVLGLVAACVVAGCLGASAADVPAKAPAYQAWASTPPMGWNSWDCFGTAVTETLAKENIDYMADKLKAHGWQYITVDIQWYEPKSSGFGYRKGAALDMDAFGRLIPADTKFPSATKELGFKPLADYVHGKGLKFGIHMMRGIPRQAVTQNTPILGTDKLKAGGIHAADIVKKVTVVTNGVSKVTEDICPWNPDMYGIDMTKPGSQEYYDSVLALVASWGVDFVKVDDLSRPYPEHQLEVEAIRKAIDKTGRPMVFSTSPGETPLASGEHVASHANMWRISDDFWDSWKSLKEQFVRLDNWTPFRGPGHYPDADMLPLGSVKTQSNGWTKFTHDEQITLMTMWSMAQSPLIMGGHLPKNDDWTLALMTNDEVIAVDQHSTGGKQLSRAGDIVIWVADVPESKDRYVAFFNATDAATPAAISVSLHDLGFSGHCTVRDLWTHKDLGDFTNEFSADIAKHGAGLYRVTPK